MGTKFEAGTSLQRESKKSEMRNERKEVDVEARRVDAVLNPPRCSAATKNQQQRDEESRQ